MYKFHQTPFEQVIDNILDVMRKHDAAYTFPTVASVASQKPELLKKIIDSKSEIAVHGYKHVKYPLISPQEQENDMRKAILVYRKLGITINGFRAPYNAYDSHMPEIIEKNHFIWDAGIGYSKENRTRSDFFRITTQAGRQLEFTCIPLNELSDDAMIDDSHYSNSEMLRLLKSQLDSARTARGVVMFDLHPIRMGQPEYVAVIDELIAYGKSIGGWFPTVSDAVRIRAEKAEWNGREFCCLLTGDIDNFYFRDYLKRLV